MRLSTLLRSDAGMPETLGGTLDARKIKGGNAAVVNHLRYSMLTAQKENSLTLALKKTRPSKEKRGGDCCIQFLTT